MIWFVISFYTIAPKSRNVFTCIDANQTSLDWLYFQICILKRSNMNNSMCINESASGWRKLSIRLTARTPQHHALYSCVSQHASQLSCMFMFSFCDIRLDGHHKTFFDRLDCYWNEVIPRLCYKIIWTG